MEGEGLYASAFGSVEWIAVKAICDFAGYDGPKNKTAQPQAAAAAASLLHFVLSRPTALRGLGIRGMSETVPCPLLFIYFLTCNRHHCMLARRCASSEEMNLDEDGYLMQMQPTIG